MPDSRRDPAELLARLQRDESRTGDSGRHRGRLKIFFGMSPGVGKTFAMLAAAQRLAAQGVDVAIGIVETHGRTETEQMTLGQDILPRKIIEYRGPDGKASPVNLYEFDLDAALARKPDVLLIDELAHTNAPGSRHDKRWQDVQACLAAGISVYTTLNVQHIESLNDIVAQITGVQVRETIPDSVVEQADEIELVDIPPDALLERLRAGKVYMPESARHAADSFFRTGNLTALRQLALRRTAEWVDQRMRQYKDDQGIRAVWPATERIAVAVSPSPTSPDLVRAAKRMAAGLRAQLLAVYVEPGNAATMRPADRERVMQTLRLAESLGAQTSTITSGAGTTLAAAELVSFARARNVNRILIGKTQASRWRESLGIVLGGGSFVNEVIRAAGEIEVSVLPSGNDDAPASETRASDSVSEPAAPRSSDPVRAYIFAILIVALCTGLAALIFRRLDLANIVMLYLAGVVVAAMRLGRNPAILATILGVAAFDFFFVPPNLTFAVTDVQYVITFAVMLTVGILIASLTTRLKVLVENARERERRAASLYAMTRELAAAQSPQQAAMAACEHVAAMFDCDTILAVPSSIAPGGVDCLASAGSGPDWLDLQRDGISSADRTVARWVLDNGKPAGIGTLALPGASARFVPLLTPLGRIGVLGLHPRAGDAAAFTTQKLLLLETFAGQIASSLERVQLIESTNAAQVQIAAERLRSALLSSVSHDLRTPLAGIAGAASTLKESGDELDRATRRELVDSIVSESQRLNDLIANLVFATRLESGEIDLRREWTTVEEIVGAGLSRHREALASRPLKIIGIHSGENSLPMIRVDNAMLPQVISNLVENALRYTPAGTPLSISAWEADNAIVIKVADQGPGLREGETARVFDRFYRGRSARSAPTADSAESPRSAGLGLGLTICDGIIKAHGGRIWAEPNITPAGPSGVAFLFSIPLDEPQPRMTPESPASASVSESAP